MKKKISISIIVLLMVLTGCQNTLPETRQSATLQSTAMPETRQSATLQSTAMPETKQSVMIKSTAEPDGLNDTNQYSLLFKSDVYNLSLYYDKYTSEFVCTRNSRELGDRVRVTSAEVKEFTKQFHRGFALAYITESNEIILPIILDNDGNISFHLVKIGEQKKAVEEEWFCLASKGGQEYRICNDEYIVLLKNLTGKRDIGYCSISYVEGSEIEFEEVKLDYSNINSVEISMHDGPATFVTATTDEYELEGIYQAKKYIMEMIEAGLFQEKVNDGEQWYTCSNWSEAEEIINESMK